jgi:hypothetical protein
MKEQRVTHPEIPLHCPFCQALLFLHRGLVGEVFIKCRRCARDVRIVINTPIAR